MLSSCEKLERLVHSDCWMQIVDFLLQTQGEYSLPFHVRSAELNRLLEHRSLDQGRIYSAQYGRAGPCIPVLTFLVTFLVLCRIHCSFQARSANLKSTDSASLIGADALPSKHPTTSHQTPFLLQTLSTYEILLRLHGHGQGPLPSNQQNHKCPTCDKLFESAYYLVSRHSP